jgi:hypothetical protein
MMDPETIQAEKNAFAAAQTPPIEPCTHPPCKFMGCTCGSNCGCNQPIAEGKTSCDPCMEFKAKKQAEQAAAAQAN